MGNDSYCDSRKARYEETKKTPEQCIERYRSSPTSVKEYESGGKKFTVIRHFSGEKELNQTVGEIAVCRVNREMGLS